MTDAATGPAGEGRPEDGTVECAFGPCTCRVAPIDEYCAPICRFGIGSRSEPCKCGHSQCTATSGKG